MMKRRKALASMGISLGYLAITPTVLTLAQSCVSKPETVWTPEFFTEDEGAAIKELVDIILPKTETPSASEVNVHEFIDRYALEIMDKETQDFFSKGFKAFLNKIVADSGKTSVKAIETDTLEFELSSVLSGTLEEEKKIVKLIALHKEALKQDKQPLPLKDSTLSFAFLHQLRELTIFGYKVSEKIGEEILAYLPVPGEYVACGDVTELTNNKAWSL